MTSDALSDPMVCEIKHKNGHVMTSTYSMIEKLLNQLERQQFYGSLELKLEHGQIVLIRKTETIKPNDYRDTRGTTDDQGR